MRARRVRFRAQGGKPTVTHVSGTTMRARCHAMVRFLLLCALGASGVPIVMVDRARADDREQCLTLSFAPLDQTIPACSRMIESGDLADKEMYDALMARARAAEFALTYHVGHEIEPAALLNAQLADLGRAVEIARRLPAEAPSGMILRRALSRRAAVHAAIGRHDRAVEDYTEAIGLGERPNDLDLFGRSLAFERLGRLDRAIQDMSAIIRMSAGDSNLANRLVRRAELHEAAGNTDAAVADYRRAAASRPDHRVARKALERLTADP